MVPAPVRVQGPPARRRIAVHKVPPKAVLKAVVAECRRRPHRAGSVVRLRGVATCGFRDIGLGITAAGAMYGFRGSGCANAPAIVTATHGGCSVATSGRLIPADGIANRH